MEIYTEAQWDKIRKYYAEFNIPENCKFCGKNREDNHTPETMKVHGELMTRGGHSFICTSPNAFADYVRHH